MRYFELLVDLPFLKKGRVYAFDDDTGNVFSVINGEVASYPLRNGLSGYLWMLLTVSDKYMVDRTYDRVCGST